jgi:hypothetical protein
MTPVPLTKTRPHAGPPPPDVPRWANVAAHVVPLTTLPSGLWRLAVAVGIPVGFSGELAELYSPGRVSFYIVALSIVAEGLALLTLGLVRPWGERAPAWLPMVGGRQIPTAAAAVPALLGAAVITLVSVAGVFRWNGPENMGDPDAPQGLAGFAMTVCYAPLVAWGPLLAAVTFAYIHRRRDLLRSPARAGLPYRYREGE